jgi:hypothetical protein
MTHPRLPSMCAAPVLVLALALAPLVSFAGAQQVQITSPAAGTLLAEPWTEISGRVQAPAPVSAVYVRTRYPGGALCPPVVETGATVPGALGWMVPVTWNAQLGQGVWSGKGRWLAPGSNFVDVYLPGGTLGQPAASVSVVYQDAPPPVPAVALAVHALSRSVDVVDAAGQPGKLGFMLDLINPSPSLTQAIDVVARLRGPGGIGIDLPLGGPGQNVASYVLTPLSTEFCSTVTPGAVTFAFATDQPPFPAPLPLGGYELSVEVRAGAILLAENGDVSFWVQDRSGLPFRDATALGGLDGVRLQGGPLPAAGACLAVWDYDQDGLRDVYVSNPGGAQSPLALGGLAYPGGSNFLMRGLSGGAFTDVSQASGTAGAPPISSYGVAWGDLDGDGDDDLFVANRAAPPHVYRNNGDGTFSDVAPGSFASTGSAWGMVPRLGDYDADGDLDIYVGTYVKTFASTWKATGWTNRLYKNLLAEGQMDPLYPGFPAFVDVAPQAGVANTGLTLGALWLDAERDGDLDLAVFNDFGAFAHPNTLYRNDGGDQFTDVGGASGFAVQEFSMGAVAADFDGDGDLEVFSTNIGRDSLLFGLGAGQFAQGIDGSGCEGDFLELGPQADGVHLDNSWGAVALDFDRDGDRDLFVVGGDLFTNEQMPIAEAHPSSAYLNDGSGHFVQAAAVLGLSNAGRGRGAEALDYDLDGDLDLLVANDGEGLTLYRNDWTGPNRWIGLRPFTTRSAPGGFNTWFEVSLGAKTQVHELMAESAHGSQADNSVQFGCGDAPAGATALVHAEWTRGGSTSYFHEDLEQELAVWETVVEINGAIETSAPALSVPSIVLRGRPGALVLAGVGNNAVSVPLTFPSGEPMDLWPFVSSGLLYVGTLDAAGEAPWNLGPLPNAPGEFIELQMLEIDTVHWVPRAKSGLSRLTIQ